MFILLFSFFSDIFVYLFSKDFIDLYSNFLFCLFTWSLICDTTLLVDPNLVDLMSSLSSEIYTFQTLFVLDEIPILPLLPRLYNLDVEEKSYFTILVRSCQINDNSSVHILYPLTLFTHFPYFYTNTFPLFLFFFFSDTKNLCLESGVKLCDKVSW